ncbi:unnamed protein product [Urochloa humidicola]
MDDVVTKRNSPADGTNRRLLLLLSLSLSPASKVIAKAAAGKHHRARLADGGAFRCRTCGRQFATFQALGGHRTSHNRPRVRAVSCMLRNPDTREPETEEKNGESQIETQPGMVA